MYSCVALCLLLRSPAGKGVRASIRILCEAGRWTSLGGGGERYGENDRRHIAIWLEVETVRSNLPTEANDNSLGSGLALMERSSSTDSIIPANKGEPGSANR
jgi:hypothetical protein